MLNAQYPNKVEDTPQNQDLHQEIIFTGLLFENASVLIEVHRECHASYTPTVNNLVYIS